DRDTLPAQRSHDGKSGPVIAVSNEDSHSRVPIEHATTGTYSLIGMVVPSCDRCDRLTGSGICESGGRALESPPAAAFATPSRKPEARRPTGLAASPRAP